MTELKVEKKRRFPVVWTILAIIAIAVIVWIVVDNDNSIYEDDLATTEDAESYDVESGYAEAEDWNGNDIDPWAGDSVWNDNETWGDNSDVNSNETWGDDSDVPEDEYTLEEQDDNTFGPDYSGALGTDVTDPDENQQSEKVDDFVSFAENLDVDNLNRRTAHEGLSKLTMALSALTDRDMDTENKDEVYHGSARMQGQTGNMQNNESAMRNESDMRDKMQDKNMNMDTSDMHHNMMSGEGLNTDIRRLRQQVEQLKDERMSGMQASIIRSAFMEAATVFKELQAKHYPDLQQEASEVMDAAQDINAQDMASNQRIEIKQFFDEAADAIEKVRDEDASASSDY